MSDTFTDIFTDTSEVEQNTDISDEDNYIDPLNMSQYPQNQKGNYIVPDMIMEQYYKSLPDGTVNESNTVMAYHGGILKMFQKGESSSIQVAGGKALQAQLKQRRTFKETLEYLLAQPSKDDPSIDNQTAILKAMLTEASTGNTRASEFIRDTIGQKPVDKSETEITGATPAQMALINNVYNRLSADQPEEQTETAAEVLEAKKEKQEEDAK